MYKNVICMTIIALRGGGYVAILEQFLYKIEMKLVLIQTRLL